MTQEIKLKLEQSAHKWYGNTHGDRSKNIFKHGAQTILENPGEWGLKEVNESWFAIVDELAKYREALERITEESWSFERPHKIAKEALKQQ